MRGWALHLRREVRLSVAAPQRGEAPGASRRLRACAQRLPSASVSRGARLRYNVNYATICISTIHFKNESARTLVGLRLFAEQRPPLARGSGPRPETILQK